VTHVSNFRPVKRIEAVLQIFDRIRKKVPARLLLVGDGPELSTAYRVGRELGISGMIHSVGAQEEVVPLLSVSDLFLLPSAQESFGLAALEAMACEVPVIASRVGGLPEVIEDGISGFLHPPDALDDMAASAIALLTDPERHRAMAKAACRRVRLHFCADLIVPVYERCYESMLTKKARAS
jgi:N-acetyl-alpha-D-glucosaminyl L-malate synthase BshA